LEVTALSAIFGRYTGQVEQSMSSSSRIAPSSRTEVRRVRERARYDREVINEILDGGILCHVGFVFDGRPVIIPTLYWRSDDRIFLHGSTASRMMRAIEGTDACIGVTHLDGLVLAHSAFHHSANYRSVCVFGRPQPVPANEQESHLRDFMEGLFPGRWETLRPVRARELNATRLLTMPIDEASAKVRHGPLDEPAKDGNWPTWAGVLPLVTSFGVPLPDRHSEAAGLSAVDGSVRIARRPPR
jgi:nitroimidazol reductase NimA-like FMN-containing flavoprotein (pyridoxamine 5'-phosphate oxidase superfamily)